MAAFAEMQRTSDVRSMIESKWTLGDIIGTLRKRRVSFLTVLAAFLLATTMYCLLATSRYEATGQIEIQKDNAGTFGLDNSLRASDSASDALDYNVSLETEVNILRSDSLALQVIRELHLEADRDFYPPAKNGQAHLPEWLLFGRKLLSR